MEGRRFPDVAGDLDSLERLVGGPAWLVAGRPTGAARAVIDRMARAAEFGLPAESYGAARLALEADGIEADAAAGRPPVPARAARFDVGLSVQALRFVSALARGRVQPERVHRTLRLPAAPFDAVARVDSLCRGVDPDALLDRVQPPWIHYRTLLAALARYRAIARDSSLVPLPPLPRVLAPGQPYAGAARLRLLLASLGDLPLVQARTGFADTLFDSTLVAAVRSFQARQGLTVDGIVGGRTAGRLNRPLALRVREIELALERWRWLPRRFAEPPLFVNVPAFRLYAFRGPLDRESEMLAMDVIVGSAYVTETPMFTASMTHVVFRPFWDVPHSIAVGEIRPRAVRDPGWFVGMEYELVEGGRVLAPTGRALRRIGRGVRVRQRPGPGNALGNVKFIFPNPYSIYLHDTNAPLRFGAERRDFSHGCIRISDPVGLAEHVLRHEPEWTRERIERAMEGERSEQAWLSRPIPVLILYATAVAGEDGRLRLYPDVYGLDEELAQLLAEGYPYAGR